MANDKDFKVKNGIKSAAYHEAVGTVVSGSEGYSLVAASYDSKSFSVASQEGNSRSLFIKPDGLAFYITGVNNDTVYQYTMSTAWDISTGSYASKSLSVAAQELNPNSVFFKSDGTKLYVMGSSGDDINQYSLSTAWDISTATFDSVTFSIASQETTPYDLQFKSDGTKLYVSGSANKVYQYSLSTAWDISTASYDTVFADVSSTGSNVQSTAFSADGLSLFVSYISTQGVVYLYTLSTAWDVSTASYSSVSFTPNESITGAVVGLTFDSNGSKMYLMDYGTDLIYQYSTVLNTKTLDLSTGSVFEITPTSDIQVSLSNPADSGTVSGATLLLENVAISTYDLANASYDGVSFSVAGQETNPACVTFKPDGTKMYVTGNAGDDVNEYDLGTPWDISTASYLQNFSVSSQDLGPTDVQFKPDGTKMYICGNGNDRVYQYSLSTAWDVSAASYDSVFFSLTSQGTSPSSLFFKPDGTSFYTIDYTPDTIFKYDLSTPWDLSTASYSGSSFTVNSQDTAAFCVSFKPDGTKMYVVGSTGDDINQYSLGTAWDITTATFDNITFSVVGQDNVPWSMFWKSDGTKMYVVGDQTDTIYQYSTATPATITYPTNITWPGGTAPTSPAIGETDVIIFTTRDGGTTYNAALAIDGAA